MACSDLLLTEPQAKVARPPISDATKALALSLVHSFFHTSPAGRFAANVKLLSVSNAVGGANLGIEMSETVLRKVLPTVTKKNFTGLITALGMGTGASRMTFTVLWFDPGSIQLVGAHNADTIRLAVQHIVRLFRSYGYPASIRYISIDNRVAQGEMFPIALEKLDGNLPGYDTTYIPGSFPGLVCEHKKGKATFMVFARGRTMALGISDIEEATRQYLAIAAVASHVASDTNEAMANKSRERAILKFNQQTMVTDEENARSAAVAEVVAKAVKKYLKVHSVGESGFARRMKEHIAKVSEEAVKKLEADEAAAASAVCGKRKSTPGVRGRKRTKPITGIAAATAASADSNMTTAPRPSTAEGILGLLRDGYIQSEASRVAAAGGHEQATAVSSAAMYFDAVSASNFPNGLQ